VTVVGAYCCSHGALMMTREGQAPAGQRDSIYGAFDTMGDQIRAAEPDAVVLFGTDHGRIYSWDLVPALVLGVGDEAQGIGDAGTPTVTWPVHGPIARKLLEESMRAGIDLAYSERMRIDHSFVAPLLLMGLAPDLPVVPFMLNCNAPPIPRLERSLQIGRAVGAVLNALPERVVIIGTGGLSHWVGSPERREYLRSPAGTRWQDAAKLRMELEDTGPINTAFDLAFLDALARGTCAQFLAEWPEARIEEEAGNGAQEIRNWAIVAAAVPERRARILSYEPVDEWLTGSAVVAFE
jgi:2,3-dihydroxyphenylpropionate 1,2-dioxygenase